MARVFVDTNVLFPFSVMDLMLALTEDAVHEVVWTDALLDEWELVIVRTHRRSAESAAAITAAIREFFPECEVAEKDYASLVSSMPGRDPDDRRHMAAAVTGGASAIVTWNRADFPSDALARHGLRVLSPDEYLCELIVDFPLEVRDTVIRLAAEKRRPRRSPYDLAASLAHAGVENFAARLTDHLDANATGVVTRPTVGRSRHRPRRTTVAATDVAAHLAAHRPPASRSVTLVIPPHAAVGRAAHPIVLGTALLEMLTVWPAGTTLVIDYANQTYAQALAYPPTMETEIGPIGRLEMRQAVQFGWIDPSCVRARHDDFESQPVWDRNPVREWRHPYDRPRDVAAFLSASVRAVLRARPHDGYTLRIFNNRLGR